MVRRRGGRRRVFAPGQHDQRERPQRLRLLPDRLRLVHLRQEGEVRLSGRVRAAGVRGAARQGAAKGDRARNQEGARGRQAARGRPGPRPSPRAPPRRRRHRAPRAAFLRRRSSSSRSSWISTWRRIRTRAARQPATYATRSCVPPSRPRRRRGLRLQTGSVVGLPRFARAQLMLCAAGAVCDTDRICSWVAALRAGQLVAPRRRRGLRLQTGSVVGFPRFARAQLVAPRRRRGLRLQTGSVVGFPRFARAQLGSTAADRCDRDRGTHRSGPGSPG